MLTESGASRTITRSSIDQAIDPTSTIVVETASQAASPRWIDVLASGDAGGYGDLAVGR
jgi:hypothetical protein